TFMNGELYGLMLEGCNGSRVEGCAFYLSRDGLVVKDSYRLTVEDSVMMFNTRSGLQVIDSEDTSVLMCSIADNDRYGVWITGGAGNELEQTTVYENLRGVVLDSAPNVTVIRCLINASSFEGVVLSPGSDNVSIISCEVYDCTRSGLEGDNVENLTLWDTNFMRNGYYGVRLLNGTSSVTINQTNVRDNGYDGLHIERSRDLLILRGTYRDNGYNGMFLIDVNNTTVWYATLRNNTYDGLNCDNCAGLVIEGVDTLYNNYNGVNLQAGTHDVLVDGGVNQRNLRSGLGIDSAFNVTVVSTNSVFNSDFGLLVEGGAFDIEGSLFLTNNTKGALRVQDSHDVRLNSSLLAADPSGGYLIYARNADDIWISNSTTNGTAHLINGANVSMVHCTFDDVITDVDGRSWLKYYTLVDVQVLWPNLTPVDGAVVNATGRGGQKLVEGVTGPDGWTGEMVLLMETHIAEMVGYQNPYTFWASKGTEVARNETNVLGRSTVQIILQDDLPPVAVADDVSAELGERAVLNGTGSHDNGQLVSWTWTFEDGVGTVVLDGRMVNWTFTVLGNFTGQLEVADSVGLTDTKEFTIVVTDTTPPLAVAGENVTIDQGEWVLADGTNTTDNDSTLIATGLFVWRVVPEEGGPGVRAFTGPIVSVQFPDMGVYRVELNVTDQSGNRGTDAFWVTVLDITPPSVDAGPDVQVDEGSEATVEPQMVTDNDPDFGSTLTAWWQVTGPMTDLTMDGLVLVFIPPVMGEYTATLHVTDASGNEATDQVIVTARDKLPPVVDIGMDRTVEVHDQVSFDASGVTDNDPDFPEGASYRWSVSGPRLEEERVGDSITFTVPWIGDYVVTLTVTDANGNEGTGSVTVASVDTVDPEFGTFVPGHTDTSETGDVSVTFVITDLGTGVDAEAVEMRMRKPSDAPWSEWQRVSVTPLTPSHVEETMVLQFPEGDSMVQLRCRDLAGNGPVESDMHLVRVNSRPTVVVLSPLEGATYSTFDLVLLDASASSDRDGDELWFTWNSDVDGLLGTNATVRSRPLTEGTHRITVVVSDGVSGHDVLVEVSITVLPPPSTVDPDEGVPWWVLLLAAILFLGFGLVVWDHMRRRREPPRPVKDDEWVETTD
ncbi:MAG: right-handed parallel beta-helix repeat-containing protein, partial [Thermoplasmata archaeon]